MLGLVCDIVLLGFGVWLVCVVGVWLGVLLLVCRAEHTAIDVQR